MFIEFCILSDSGGPRLATAQYYRMGAQPVVTHSTPSGASIVPLNQWGSGYVAGSYVQDSVGGAGLGSAPLQQVGTHYQYDGSQFGAVATFPGQQRVGDAPAGSLPGAQSLNVTVPNEGLYSAAPIETVPTTCTTTTTLPYF